VFALKNREIFIEERLKWREVLLIGNLAFYKIGRVHQVVKDSLLAHLDLTVSRDSIGVGVGEVVYELLD
jgi:hypothetical protein